MRLMANYNKSRRLPPLRDNNTPTIKNKNESNPSDSQKRSRKKLKRNVPPENEISKELEGIEEDVINRASGGFTERPLSIIDHYIPSQPDGKLYVEKEKKFKAEIKVNVENKKSQVTKLIQERWNDLSSVQQTLLSHKIFKTISLFIHGLFSGIALWQIVSTYILLHNGTTNFLTNYSALSMPVQCSFYFFFVICTISAFDRYDIWKPVDGFLKKALTFQNGAICIVFYGIGFLCSVSNYKIESYIGQHHRNSTFWINIEGSEASSILQVWQILNLIRGISSILGWFVISLSPGTDHFSTSLKNLKEKT